MTWITPKTNWVSSDYYNLDDAKRIAGNICHLKEMATEIYGTEYINCLVLRKAIRQSGSTFRYCGREQVNPRYIFVADPSEYTRDLAFWADKDGLNFAALGSLIMLSKKSAPVYYENIPIDRYIPNDVTNPQKFFTGDAISDLENYDQTYSSYESNAFNALFIVNDPFNSYLPRLPIQVEWTGFYGDSSQCRIMVNGAYSGRLKNNYFYNSIILNLIENRTLQVYNKLSSY